MTDRNAPTTLAEIAKALKLGRSRTADLVAKHGCPYTTAPVRGGQQRQYPLEYLPNEVRQAVIEYRQAQQIPADPLPAAIAPDAIDRKALEIALGNLRLIKADLTNQICRIEVLLGIESHD